MHLSYKLYRFQQLTRKSDLHKNHRSLFTYILFVFAYKASYFLFLVIYGTASDRKSFNDIGVRFKLLNSVDGVGESAALMGRKNDYLFP